jgi:ABC-type transporter Mla MlaB component
MTTKNGVTRMEMYLNDSVKTFEFVLRGELKGDAVRSLEYAWITATSILDGKEVLVDVTGLTAADATGIELLHRMRGSGACLRAAPRPNSERFLRSLGVVVAAPPREGSRSWRLSLRQLFGLAA